MFLFIVCMCVYCACLWWMCVWHMPVSVGAWVSFYVPVEIRAASLVSSFIAFYLPSLRHVLSLGSLDWLACELSRSSCFCFPVLVLYAPQPHPAFVWVWWFSGLHAYMTSTLPQWTIYFSSPKPFFSVIEYIYMSDK